MKPKIGDIWLDMEGEHSLIYSIEETGSRWSEPVAGIYVLDSELVKNGGEDYTFGTLDQFGEGKFFHTLVARIDEKE